MKKIESIPKILLVTSGDSLASLACHRVFYSDGAKVISVVKVNADYKKKISILKSAFKKRALWYLLYIYFEMFFSKFYTSVELDVRSVEKTAIEKNIPIHKVTLLDFENLSGLIKKYEPDIVLSVRPGMIFQNSIIKSSPIIINLHCSALPAYAGIGGVIQALANNERWLGVSLHQIEDEKIDSGTILAQSFVKTQPNGSVLWHTSRLYMHASNLLLNYIENNSSFFETKANFTPSYYSWPTLDVYRKLRSFGRGLIFPIKVTEKK